MAVLAEPPAETAASGVDFSLTEDQQLLRDEVRRFAVERIQPGVAERDREHRFPVDIFQEMGEMGLLGMLVPEEYGGAGTDTLSYLLTMEEVSRVDPAVAVTMSVTNSVCCWPIVQFGSEELKRRVLPSILSGEKISALAITEPGGGSDVASLKTSARKENNEYVVSGEKTFITSGTKNGGRRYFASWNFAGSMPLRTSTRSSFT